MKIEVRTPNEDSGCALYKGAHYTPKNTVIQISLKTWHQSGGIES